MVTRLTRFAWFVLLFNVGVILLGALVRATESGAGCGRSWPTCHGELVPELSGATAIEYAHRSASGVSLVLALVLATLVWRQFDRGEPVRTSAALALAATVGSALIGAAIVLAEWVADDASIARVVAVPLHLVNTFLLLASLSLTVFWLSGGQRLDIRRNPRLWRWLLVGGSAIVLIAATGAITALADTLFPKEGIGIELEAGSHFLTRLRVIHPILAVVAVVIAWWKLSPGAGKAWAHLVTLLVGAMMVTGILNVALGVPVWMQLVHLALADGLWISYVFLAAKSLEGASTMAVTG